VRPASPAGVRGMWDRSRKNARSRRPQSHSQRSNVAEVMQPGRRSCPFSNQERQDFIAAPAHARRGRSLPGSVHGRLRHGGAQHHGADRLHLRAAGGDDDGHPRDRRGMGSARQRAREATTVKLGRAIGVFVILLHAAALQHLPTTRAGPLETSLAALEGR
jgi:hypothetical protein